MENVNQAVKSYKTRTDDMSKLFAFVTPAVVALDRIVGL